MVKTKRGINIIIDYGDSIVSGISKDNYCKCLDLSKSNTIMIIVLKSCRHGSLKTKLSYGENVLLLVIIWITS